MWPGTVTRLPLIVQKSDGGFTYDTSDLAAIRYRLLEVSANWLIYVIDMGQGTHMQGIYGAAEIAGWWNRKTRRVDHVGFGVVLGEDSKKLRSRNPEETLRLRDLLDEGLERAKARLIEKNRDKVSHSKRSSHLIRKEIAFLLHSKEILLIVTFMYVY